MWSCRRRERHPLPANSCCSSCDEGGRRFIAFKKKKKRKRIVFFQSVFRSVIYTTCSTQHFHGQKSGERLTWLNLSVVDICFAGELSGWREEDGVIQSAQEFFFFFYLLSWRKIQLFWHVWKNSVLFYSSSWNLLDGRGLSHTAVENIPVRSQKVSNPASLLSAWILCYYLWKHSKRNRFMTQLWRILCGCVVAFSWENWEALCREAPEVKWYSRASRPV